MKEEKKKDKTEKQKKKKSASTVSKLSSESTALDLALLSSSFISRLYLVLHSVIRMVQAAEDTHGNISTSVLKTSTLTATFFHASFV